MQLETDYLVIGSGATGMAFVDTLLAETDSSVVMLDDRAFPGGHWNDAYPFVRLHQPAANYGVHSKALGKNRIDTTGTNAGYCELSSGVEIARYYHELMEDVFVPSGRVQFLPMTRYTKEGDVVSLLSGEKRSVTARKKVVYANYLTTEIPATHRRKFDVDSDVVCAPPNHLPRLATQHEALCVLGAGKTATDSISWLLEHGCYPDRILWVKPRDSWFLNRRGFQMGPEFFEGTIGGLAQSTEIYATAESVRDLEEKFEAAGIWLRVDEDVWPEMFHAAIVTERDIDLLRRVNHVLRSGRVERIERGRLHFASSEVEVPDDTLFVDCTAGALSAYVGVRAPVFQPGEIHLQAVRQYQPCFSAALLAFVEANFPEEEKNGFARPAPNIDSVEDVLLVAADSMLNQASWTQSPEISAWRARTRLDGFGQMIAAADRDDPQQAAILGRLLGNTYPAIENLQRLAAEAGVTPAVVGV
ncbi:MAG: NAD(P)/FAD-dependent oxidoreductase [Acidobacteriota bacterium]